MVHLIDKAALVAEIERRYETNLIGSHSAFKNGKIEALREIKDFLDTLEVKEVDLDEEIEKCLKQHNMLAVGKKDFTEIAKHFFELALSLNK